MLCKNCRSCRARIRTKRAVSSDSGGSDRTRGGGQVGVGLPPESEGRVERFLRGKYRGRVTTSPLDVSPTVAPIKNPPG